MLPEAEALEESFADLDTMTVSVPSATRGAEIEGRASSLRHVLRWNVFARMLAMRQVGQYGLNGKWLALCLGEQASQIKAALDMLRVLIVGSAAMSSGDPSTATSGTATGMSQSSEGRW